METFNQFFELEDIWKALIALVFGIILGYERESKDKAAGLKTISVITIGSCLFTILSQNFSGEGDNFAIAAGIISGVGFLGAGVIFKEGFSIYGLTTAGIIWISAAIGMAVGFGEIYIAAIFLVSTLLIIYGMYYVGKLIVPSNNSRYLIIEIVSQHIAERKKILKQLDHFTDYQTVTKTEKKDNGNFSMHIDVQITTRKTEELEDFLLNSNYIESYSL